METRVSLQPSYVLHSRPFQNTSLLLDFFCIDYGRVRAVAKGARREKSKYRSLLQLFHPLLVSFSGNGEVKTVTSIESGVSAINLIGERLFSGMYMNELLTRLLLNQVEHKALYKSYQDALLALQGTSNIEVVLRGFELSLLSELGYAINLESDCHSHAQIEESSSYRFTPDFGFELLNPTEISSSHPNLFSGAHLIALRELQLGDRSTAQAAKRLLRLALSAHLGEKPITSRSLFVKRG
jgi:DNA repair protein RecO (recombination protein O)